MLYLLLCNVRNCGSMFMCNHPFLGKLALSNLKCYHYSFVKIILNFYISRIIKRMLNQLVFLDCILFVFHIFTIKLIKSVRMLFSPMYWHHSDHYL